jgi:hypothetical protein
MTVLTDKLRRCGIDDAADEIERLEARLAEAERLLSYAADTCSPYWANQIDDFLRPADCAEVKP